MPNTKTLRNYISELLANPNNILINNCKRNIKKAYDDTVMKTCRIGYLIIRGFKMSRSISKKLGVNNKLVLLVSRGKIKTMSFEHNIDSKQFYGVIKKATKSPEVIVYDSSRNSFQFYVDYNENFYRVVIEFDAIPIGMKCVRANILITLFKNTYYERKIKGIFEGRFPELFVRFEKKEWMALIHINSSKQEFK